MGLTILMQTSDPRGAPPLAWRGLLGRAPCCREPRGHGSPSHLWAMFNARAALPDLTLLNLGAARELSGKGQRQRVGPLVLLLGGEPC